MKRRSWTILVGTALILVSALLYVVHYFIFHDVHHILLWSFTNFCFLPISALVVTLVINRLLTQREKQAKLQKLNMVIGAFYSEVGTRLLGMFSGLDGDVAELNELLVVDATWPKAQFQNVQGRLQRHGYAVVPSVPFLEELKDFLVGKRDFLLRLLENPNLLEHEAFTSLLRAVFHLLEELEHRPNMRRLPPSDIDHLAGDIRRAYALVTQQWLAYMRFMKTHYPYLFSLAMRTNPFDQDATPVVGESV